MADVLAKRLEQITQHGHTAEADAATPLFWLVGRVHKDAIGLQEDIQFHRRDIPRLRRHAIRHAALALALVDRIDAEQAPENGPENTHG